ncbi:MAG: hypothetical protein FJ315_04770, partial [SAR202 cluster bacterium]|nr:hypothetical protein [SAR202 cluster bacterium]
MTTTSPRTVDPGRVILTGENPFIRLAETDGGPVTTDASFWRILLSPAGPGHVLFLTSELTGGQPRVYSDNIALARWLQQEIMGRISQLFGDTSIPVRQSHCESSGDLRSFWTETVWSRGEDGERDRIALTWYDLQEPFLIHSQAGSNTQRPHGVCSLFVPAYGVRVTLNGRHATGRAFPRDREGR